MHPAALQWEHFARMKIGPGEIPVPTPDRPCDRCGQPVGAFHKRIHTHCLQQERQEAFNAVAEYLIDCHEFNYGVPSTKATFSNVYPLPAARHLD